MISSSPRCCSHHCATTNSRSASALSTRPSMSLQPERQRGIGPRRPGHDASTTRTPYARSIWRTHEPRTHRYRGRSPHPAGCARQQHRPDRVSNLASDSVNTSANAWASRPAPWPKPSPGAALPVSPAPPNRPPGSGGTTSARQRAPESERVALRCRSSSVDDDAWTHAGCRTSTVSARLGRLVRAVSAGLDEGVGEGGRVAPSAVVRVWLSALIFTMRQQRGATNEFLAAPTCLSFDIVLVMTGPR